MTMTISNTARARNFAATLLTLSGISHIAALWFRDISGPALAAALFGGLYLIIGLGLYGQSRFALLMAIAGPFAGAWLALSNTHIVEFSLLGLVQLNIAGIVIIICAVVLFAARNTPSS
jgi:hypothetical protein